MSERSFLRRQPAPADRITPELEAAARALCQRRRLDPEEDVGYPDDQGRAVVRRTRRWRLLAGEILDFLDLCAVTGVVLSRVDLFPTHRETP